MAHAPLQQYPLDPRELTWPAMPDEPVEGSAYGLIDNFCWHKREGARWSTHGAPCFIGSNGGGRIALYRGLPKAGDSKQPVMVFNPRRVAEDDHELVSELCGLVRR